ncbi:hypothetical protein QJQ45_003075 [Haematococcus lacustris]|nr:hypothetical protein QJQ45_003075 [Haematococcus lacustris]
MSNHDMLSRYVHAHGVMLYTLATMLVADNLVVQRYAIEHMWFLQTWHLVINFAFGLVCRHHAAALIYYAFGYCQAQLDSLLAEYSDVFTPLTGLPLDCPVGHTIPLEPGNRPPATPMYRLSKPEHDELKQQIQDLLAKGMIEPSSSPYAAPVLFGQNKSGELRMCIDYRQLNKITLRDQYPLPRIDDLFDKLSGCKVFSSLDLQAGYHQIRITPKDVPKTAFRTPEGHFQVKVLCFGLTNAPATFQRVMNDAFASVLGKCALVYLDDILVMSRYKRHADTGLKDVEFEVGAPVLLSARNLRIKTGKVRKFVPRYVGPFVVEAEYNANAYRLTPPANMSRLHPVFHVSLLEYSRGSSIHGRRRRPESIPTVVVAA